MTRPEPPGGEPYPTLEELERLVQFQHPRKFLAALPGARKIDHALSARLLGTDPATYTEIRGRFASSVARAARALLDDHRFAEQVDGLPFAPGDTVVALGDSLTDDFQSWVEILRHVLGLRRGGDGIRLVNAGVSGETTTDVRKRLPAVVAHEPDWVIVLLGTNDARRHGGDSTEPLVSRTETGRNLGLVRAFVRERTSAQMIWMTPPPVIEEWIAADRRFRGLELSWDGGELAARAAAVHALGGLVVDLAAAFGTPCPPGLMLADGLHPGLEGQVRILRALTGALSAS
jgi:acyl-CoA thioesterase I